MMFELRIKVGRKYEHTYTLYPKDPNILQD